MSFASAKTTRVYLLWLTLVILRLGRAQDVPHDSVQATSTIRFPRMSPYSGNSPPSCLVPPQPANGRWKLHKLFCDNDLDCDIPQGIALQVGSHLVYTCDPGYKVEDNPDVYCTAKGIWSSIPSCTQIKCSSLNTASRKVTCGSFPHKEECDDVPADTQVDISCRPWYKKDTIAFPFSRGEISFCTVNGQWEPEPMKCLPVCGVAETPETPLVMDGTGTDPSVADFPWHASLYLSNGTTKNFVCGATILGARVLLTAALCVYDEITKSSIEPGELFVITGNTFVEYDSPLHEPKIVKKAEVKSVHMFCNFQGLARNYTSDIAVLELQNPLVLSSKILPACLNLTDDTDELLRPGEKGRSVGLGRTASGASTGILNTLTLPYVSFSEYSEEDSKNVENQVPISVEKFTAGSTNGSGICGSGLVFKKNDLWYVMGILSTGYRELGENGEKICNKFSYSRYTRIGAYVEWIIVVITSLERRGSFTSCTDDNSSTQPTTTTSTPRPNASSVTDEGLPNPEDSFCLAPPQPENGEWRFHGYLCKNDSDCKIPQGAELKPGSQLVYTCAPGYRANGIKDVYCGDNGNWSTIPDCVEVKCDALNSVSTTASCSRFGKWVSCDASVPLETRAELSCNPGYKKDTAFVATRRDVVSCTENGKWKPDPIRCVPVCGVAITKQTPFAVGGSPAKIGDFPWHATLYMQKISSKDFKCGATIIHPDFLLTAAHCVYDEIFRQTVDPGKLFVMTGNIFRDYDHPEHNPEVVRKGEVKHVFKHSNYYAFVGNYVSDIALLELKQPFKFSGILLPACLDVDGYTEQILEPGVSGRLAGFGKTATGASSNILQTITVPYVSYNQCKTSKNAEQNQYFISNDKFCAGYTNGTAACDGDSGGGLVFKKNELWYVMGIVSVGLGVDVEDGERTCDKYSYTLYTKVSTYMGWIQDVISNPERYTS